MLIFFRYLWYPDSNNFFLVLSCETKYNEFYQLNLDKHIEKNIVERIRLLDSTIFSERNYSEFLRATRQKRIGVEVSSSAEKRIRREEPELVCT